MLAYECVAVALVAMQDPATLPTRHIFRVTDFGVHRPDVYPPECVEGLFSELRLAEVPRIGLLRLYEKWFSGGDSLL
jgi:hypothetical protein